MRLTVLFVVIGVVGLLFIGALGLQMQESEPVAVDNNASDTYNQSERVYDLGIGIGVAIWPLMFIGVALVAAFFMLWGAAGR